MTDINNTLTAALKNSDAESFQILSPDGITLSQENTEYENTPRGRSKGL